MPGLQRAFVLRSPHSWCYVFVVSPGGSERARRKPLSQRQRPRDEKSGRSLGDEAYSKGRNIKPGLVNPKRMFN